jgi:BlaI family penicillinase repressor
VASGLPDLSRFELQCLRLLWERGETSARAIHEGLDGAPSYSTVRKIFERLEAKGAIERTGMEGRAVIYRPTVGRGAMIRKEIGRLLDSLFDGAAAPLLSHLADMKAVDLQDLRDLERELAAGGNGDGNPGDSDEPGEGA